MTLLNLASIAFTITLFIVFWLVYRKYRRYLDDAEGAIARINGQAEGAEPPRDGMDDPPLPSIIYIHEGPNDRSQR